MMIYDGRYFFFKKRIRLYDIEKEKDKSFCTFNIDCKMIFFSLTLFEIVRIYNNDLVSFTRIVELL